MGSSDNITDKTFHELSHQLDKPLTEVKKEVATYLEKGVSNNVIFEAMFEKAARAWGQSVVEAKKNTKDLLSNEIR